MSDVLDPAIVRRWGSLAVEALGRTRADIDALNVFPVPDGDTGTNMYMTVCAAVEGVARLSEDADAPATWRALAEGALYGARGNSGVILSQVLRGMADVLGAGGTLSGALRHAADLAEGAVAHPVAGTMLTVLRAAADACADQPAAAAAARSASEGARAALALTTGQLDVLARNGVVDAGAAGLCVVLDALDAVITREYPETYEVPRPGPAVLGASGDAGAPGESGEGHGYEVMYLLDVESDDAIAELRESLDALGDSLVVVGGDGLWNVHVHADDAGAAIEAGIKAGRPHRVRVTYLNAVHTRHAGRGLVAVTTGEGLAALFTGQGARVLCRPPDRASPRVAELVEAIMLAGDEVAVLPDERDLLALAEAAAERARDAGVRVAVIPAFAAVRGLAALAVHDPLRPFGDDVMAMTTAAGATRSGRLMVASREVVTPAGPGRPGDVLGLIDDDVRVIGTDLAEVAEEVLARMLAGGGELVTLITGSAAPPSLAGALGDWIRRRRPDVEIIIYDGGQEDHPLLIGVE